MSMSKWSTGSPEKEMIVHKPSVFDANVHPVNLLVFDYIGLRADEPCLSSRNASLARPQRLKISTTKKMPKEPKEPLFCCGAYHKSANYHKRTVHQQHTKIYFKGNPHASFILKRNPVTSLFHCPHCDKSWAMATPIRNHIFQRCEGYAQFRSSAPADGGDNGEADRSLSSIDSGDEDMQASSATKQASEVEVPQEAGIGQAQERSEKPGNGQALLPSGGTENKARTPQSDDAQTSDDSTPPGQAIRPRMDGIVQFTPVLRPAVWSPVDRRTPPQMLTGSGNLSHPGHLGLAVSRPNSLSSAPSLSRSASCSSKSSARTVPDDPFAIPATTASGLKPDPDGDTSLPPVVGPYLCSRATASISSARSSQDMSTPQRRTDVEAFLQGLYRPLGHAAPHLYKVGLVTEADLDLICTMPEAWDEVGTVLQAGGITMIEWLMLKEAFKKRAKALCC
ncbi:hypothetical protein BD414DRAFT_535945 [Trametes punicea]|nr:hypothetical protein BD414DRAFT_535945 [Trametes punicea]